MFEQMNLTEEQNAQLKAIFEKETTGLVNKNAELLGKLTKSSSLKTESEAEIERLRVFEQSHKISAEEEAGKYAEALELHKTQAQRELDKISSEATKFKQMYEKQTIDNALSLEIEQAGITDLGLKQGAIAILRPQISLSEDGNAVSGDVSLKDHVANFAQTAIGKSFISVGENSGGNMKPGNASTNKYDGKKLSDLGSDEATRIFNEDKALFAELKSRG